MLQPKRQKYRRPQKGRGRLNGVSHRGTELAFGSFGIKALQTRWITARQIEAARVAITRYMQRQGQVWNIGRTRFNLSYCRMDAKTSGVSPGGFVFILRIPQPWSHG